MLSVLTTGKIKKLEKERKKQGLPWWPSGSVPACRCRGHRLSPRSGKVPRVAEKLSLGTTSSDSEARVPGAPAP